MATSVENQDIPDSRSASSLKWALASLSLSLLLSSLGTSIANVALPTLAQAFGASFQQVQWIVLAYLLAITTLIVTVGRLGDIFGRRRLMLAGISLFTLASMACGAAPGIVMLIAGRAAQGLGAAIMMALSLAFVSEAIPKERTGRAMGLLGTLSAIGTALGASLGGVLIATLGWRSIFFINLPLGLIALLLAWRFLPVGVLAPKLGRTRFDYFGTLLLAMSLAAFALAMTLGRGNFGSFNLALLAAAAIGTGLFVLVETNAASPLVPLGMFRNPVFGAGFAMSALVTTVVMATLVVGPFYLSGALALDAADVGMVMSVGPIVAALTGVPAGRIVDGIGTHRTTLAGLTGMMVGCALLPTLPTQWGVLAYLIPIAILTSGYAVFQAANNTAVMTNSPIGERGIISGLLNLSRNLGLLTGASAMGAVFAFAIESADVGSNAANKVAHGMQLTFMVATLLVVVAIVIAFASQAVAPIAERGHD